MNNNNYKKYINFKQKPRKIVPNLGINSFESLIFK